MTSPDAPRPTVHIVVRRDADLCGVVAVHASAEEARADLNVRTGRGDRPDLERKYGVESWIVQSVAARSASPDPDLRSSGVERDGLREALKLLLALETGEPINMRSDEVIRRARAALATPEGVALERCPGCGELHTDHRDMVQHIISRHPEAAHHYLLAGVTRDVLEVVRDLARESLAQRDRVIAGGWVVASLPHDQEVREWLGSTPTASATASAAGGASSPGAKTTNDALATPEQPSLDAAWRDAEAALPDGWCSISVYHYDDGDGSEHTPGTYGAKALDPAEGVLPIDHPPIEVYGYGPTPAAALRALAARLESNQG